MDVHPHDGRRWIETSERGCDSKCKLHRKAARPVLPRAVQRQTRARRARMHYRSSPMEKRRHRSGRRGKAIDGLRLSRPNRFLAGRWDNDDRADRERTEARTRPFLRGNDLHPRRN